MEILIANIGVVEIVVVAVVALVAYGKDLPGAARKVGAQYVHLRRKLQGIQRDVMDELDKSEIRKEVREIVDGVKKEADAQVGKPLDESVSEVTGVADELKKDPLPPIPTTEEAYRQASAEQGQAPPPVETPPTTPAAG